MLGVTGGLQGNVIRVAKVVASNPEENSIDIVFLDSGTRASGVQVMSHSAGTKGGFSYLPEPTQPKEGDKWSLSPTGDRDMLAIVAMVNRTPVVLGFLFPQITHAAFEQYPDMRLDRHASDLEIMTMQDGSHAVRHPCGTHSTIGDVPKLERQDFDKLYKHDRNTMGGKPITHQAKQAVKGEDGGRKEVARATVHVSDGGVVTITGHDAGGRVKATITVSGDGTINIDADSSVSIHGGNTVTITAGSSIKASAGMIDLN